MMKIIKIWITGLIWFFKKSSMIWTNGEIAKRNSRTNNNNNISTTITSEAQQAATSRFLAILGKYDTIEKLDTIEHT